MIIIRLLTTVCVRRESRGGLSGELILPVFFAMGARIWTD